MPMPMDSPLSQYIIIVIISGVMSLLLATYGFFNKSNFSGMRAFIASMVLSAWYTFAFAFELTSNSMAEIRFWINIEYMAMPFIAPINCLLVLHYVGLDKHATMRKTWWLFVIPVITLLMLLTNDFHGLFYEAVELRADAPSPIVDVSPGYWYYVHGAFTSGMMVVNIFILISHWRKTKSIYRKQMITMGLALFIPFVGAMVYVFGLSPLGIDPVPMLLGITSSLHVYSIFSAGFLTVSPIAREHIFESMRDGVLVLNLSNQIMDFNSAAAQIIPALTPHSIGKKLEDVWKRGAESTAFTFDLEDKTDKQDQQQFKWIRGKDTYYYQIRTSPLLKPNGQVAGRTIVMIDVTEYTLLQNRLRHLAEIDGLTSTFNRTTFMEKSRELMKQAYLKDRSISFILMDIDHFKQINDGYGHSVGDFALQHIVNICKQQLDTSALLGRYGGEEFAVCLPNAGIEEAAQTAERLRLTIASTPMYSSAQRIKLTASFGVTEARSSHDTLEMLLREADIALYRSKHNGRNCVHLA